MEKITELTPEQKALFPHYVEKWTAIGRGTNRPNRVKAEAAIDEVYRHAKLMPPAHKIWVPSPLTGALAIAIIARLPEILKPITGKNVRSAVYSAVYSVVYSAVDSAVRSAVDSALGKNDWYGSWYWTGIWANWCAFIDYMDEVLNVPGVEAMRPFRSLAEETTAIWPFERAVFLCEKPVELSIVGNRLHCETGMSIKFADGWGLHSLNGVTVPAWAVETPRDEIEPKKVLALDNTEQRAAIMRFVGLSRFMDALKAEEIHRHEDYRLYCITVEQEKVGPYLYMRCPSTGREFLEGVGDADRYEHIDPTIKTVEQALQWRFMRASAGRMKSGSVTFKA